MKKTIYVSIVSYRDPLLINTVKSLLETVSDQTNLIIGIVDQVKYDKSLEKLYPELLSKYSNITTNEYGKVEQYERTILYKRFDPEYTQGVGWARYINQYQISAEKFDFMYQIDSHMLFDKDWDLKLISDYEDAVKECGSDKVIITCNCKSFEVFDDGTVYKYNENDELSGNVEYLNDFRDIDYIITAVGNLYPSTNKISKAIHICAGNTLFPAKWISDVGNNMETYLTGEEQLLSIKSVVKGYKLFNPKVVVSYHYVMREPYITKPYVNSLIDNLDYDRFIRRSIQVLTEYIDSLSDFEINLYREYSNVDYKNNRFC